MAQRLATEYAKTCLRLSEEQMISFMKLFEEYQVVSKVKVFENGTQEVVFQGTSDEEIALTFERDQNEYISVGSCRIVDPKLIAFMRKAINTFKGDAIVNRIYPNYTMVYHYVRGSVVRIVELSQDQSKIIYEYKNTLGELESLFRSNQVEIMIQATGLEIDDLLDRRNKTKDAPGRLAIDQQLQLLNNRLFVLEA